MPPGKPATLPRITALKRWTWAGWYARWDWRYRINTQQRICTAPMLIKQYAKPLGYARIRQIMLDAEAAYREPKGIPVGIFMARGVLVPSAATTAPKATP